MAQAETWLKGYVLHTRAFQETSLIADVFTREQGRVSVLYRGVKSSKSKNNKARMIQPFQPLLWLWQGQRDLKTGKKVEPDGAGYFLSGTSLYSAIYMNELLVRLTFREDPHPVLFDQYQISLQNLSQLKSGDMGAIEVVLREFELLLLSELGYEIAFNKDVDFNDVLSDRHYTYDPEVGFMPVAETALLKRAQRIFKGAHLLAISGSQWQDADIRLAAKHIIRLALAPHLGDKPLESRQLFQKLNS